MHLTLKMTYARVFEASVTNNSSFQNYPHPDDHTIYELLILLISTETIYVSLCFIRSDRN